MSPGGIKKIVGDAEALHVQLDYAGLEYTLRKNIETLTNKFHEDPDNVDNLKELALAVSIEGEMPFKLNLWAVQNTYFEMLHTILPERRWRAEHGTGGAHEWVELFIELGRNLSIRVD